MRVQIYLAMHRVDLAKYVNHRNCLSLISVGRRVGGAWGRGYQFHTLICRTERGEPVNPSIQ